MTYFNRYDYFSDGEMIPFIQLDVRPTDKYDYYKQGDTTFDALSYKYYGSSLMGWVIGLANAEYLNEFDIEDGKVIRIPFPLSDVQKEYEEKITLYKSI